MTARGRGCRSSTSRAGCAWLVDDRRDVIRTATMAPDGATVFETRVDRRTRADLGVWRRALDGSTPAGAGPAADRGGRPVRADLAHRARVERRRRRRWRCSRAARSRAASASSTRTVVACGSSRTRRWATSSGSRDGRLVAHGACRGLPCPLLSMDVASGGHGRPLDELAGQAVLSRDAEGGPSSSTRSGPPATRCASSALDGRDPQLLQGDPDGRRLIAGPGPCRRRGRAPARLDPVRPGRTPADRRVRRAVLRHVPDGRAVPLGEVSR